MKAELNQYQRVRFWCEDETRIGLKTIEGRLLTLKGVKPVGKMPWVFQCFWLYGLVEPLTGESFFYEFCHLDSICFEKFLELFSQTYPDELHIIHLDNGPSHQALDLVIPKNIILLFQTSHCPQVNPIERLWEAIKDELKWVLFDDLDDLRSLQSGLQKLSQKTVASITGWKFIVDALCGAKI